MAATEGGGGSGDGVGKVDLIVVINLLNKFLNLQPPRFRGIAILGVR